MKSIVLLVPLFALCNAQALFRAAPFNAETFNNYHLGVVPQSFPNGAEFNHAGLAPVKHFQPAPLNPDGTVAETPEVKAAKASHFALFEEAKTKAFQSQRQLHSSEPKVVYTPVNSIEYSPKIYSKKEIVPAPLNHDGTVAETPEIQAAKAHHFRAHQEALSRLAYKSIH